jgi:hypothetical protein
MMTPSSFEEWVAREWPVLARREGHMPALPKSLEEAHGGGRGPTPRNGPAILAFLSATPGRWYRTRKIADALGMPLTSAKTALYRLLVNRRVQKRKGVPAANPVGFVVEWTVAE